MDLLSVVNQAWLWCGLAPKTILRTNEFGNLLIEANDGRIWRLCPEACSCEVVAMSADKLDSLWRNDEFVIDWRMEPLLEVARARLGELEDGQSYCLKVPAVLGGQYAVDNFAKMSTEGLIRSSGDLAKQIQDIPEGSKVELRVTD